MRDESEYQPLLAELETASASEAERGPSFDGDELDWDFLEAQASPVGSIDHLTEEDRDQIRQWAFFYQLTSSHWARLCKTPYCTTSETNSNWRNCIRTSNRNTATVTDAPDIRQVNAQRRTPSGRETEGDPSESVEESTPLAGQAVAAGTVGTVPARRKSAGGGRQLVEELVETYGLPFAVVNVLIEYVLLTNDYKLPRSLVEKIGWALEACQRSNRRGSARTRVETAVPA